MTQQPRVALDLDLTLADTLAVASELLGAEERITFDSYSEPFDRFGKVAYLNAIWHSWTIRPEEIPPLECDVSETTWRLSDLTEQLDIVTAHPEGIYGLNESKQAWLDNHGIFYDRYRSVEGDKQELGYDIYIDNNPHLVERVNESDCEAAVFLYDQPHNRETDGSSLRIETLRDAVAAIQADSWVET